MAVVPADVPFAFSAAMTVASASSASALPASRTTGSSEPAA